MNESDRVSIQFPQWNILYIAQVKLHVKYTRQKKDKPFPALEQ